MIASVLFFLHFINNSIKAFARAFPVQHTPFNWMKLKRWKNMAKKLLMAASVNWHGLLVDVDDEFIECCGHEKGDGDFYGFFKKIS